VRQTFEGASQPAKAADGPSLSISDEGPSQNSSANSGEQVANRPKIKPRNSDKGKGKAKAVHTSDDEDEDDAYITSNDSFSTPQKYMNGNGSAKGKGKGKEKATDGFGDDGDEDLYT
jgi:hypothetical protein